MNLKEYINKYKKYEAEELARRAAKKKRIKAYKSLATKEKPLSKTKRKFSSRSYTRAIGNPYGIKL